MSYASFVVGRKCSTCSRSPRLKKAWTFLFPRLKRHCCLNVTRFWWKFFCCPAHSLKFTHAHHDLFSHSVNFVKITRGPQALPRALTIHCHDFSKIVIQYLWCGPHSYDDGVIAIAIWGWQTPELPWPEKAPNQNNEMSEKSYVKLGYETGEKTMPGSKWKFDNENLLQFW